MLSLYLARTFLTLDSLEQKLVYCISNDLNDEQLKQLAKVFYVRGCDKLSSVSRCSQWWINLEGGLNFVCKIIFEKFLILLFMHLIITT